MRGGCADFVRTPALQEAGSFVISHIYTLVSINEVLPKSFFENQTQTEDKTFAPSLTGGRHGEPRPCVGEESVLLEVQLANPGPPPLIEVQALPPVLHPPPQGLGRG